MASEALAVLSSALLLLLWAWTAYHLVVLALGWPHSKASLRRTFDLGILRNPVDLPALTVIVAAKDEENVIGVILGQIAALQYPGDRLQVIVAEDGSRDRTRAICEAFAHAHPGVLFLHEDVSEGKAAALNRAIRHATGEVLLFLDADTRFEGDLLLRAAKFFHDHPEVDVAQAVIETYNGRPNLVAKLDKYETIAWYRGILAGKDRLGLFTPLCGTGMFIKRRALEAVGPWSVASLAEDIDMAVRLSAHGARIRMLPARVWRQPPYSVRDFIDQRKRWWGGALQAFPRALGQWRNPRMGRGARVDMLLQLVSPLVLVLGTAYFGAIALLNPLPDAASSLTSATVTGILTSQLLLLGVVVAHSITRRSARDLDLIPGIYLYWAMQLYAVLAVSLAIVLRKPPRWRVTAKRQVSVEPSDRTEAGAEAFLPPASMMPLPNGAAPRILPPLSGDHPAEDPRL